MSDLRKLAEACVPGPWVVGDHPSEVVAPCPCCGLVAKCEAFGPDGATDPNCYASSYIAAANPQAILALLDERDRLRKAIESFGNGNEFDWNILARIDSLEAERDRYREAAIWFMDNPPGTPVPDWVDQTMNSVPRK